MSDEIAALHVGKQLPWEKEQAETTEPTVEELKEADPTTEEEPVTKTPVAKETPVTTDQAVKGGPGDYSWGGYEDQKRKAEREANRVKPPNVSQEDWDNRPEWSRPLEDVLHAGSTVGAGALDFAFDAIGLVPWLKPADQWWDANKPQSKDQECFFVIAQFILEIIYVFNLELQFVKKSVGWERNLIWKINFIFHILVKMIGDCLHGQLKALME